MGKAIVYCQACGTSLREEDFERGRAFKQENHNFCVGCRPELAAPRPPPPSREPTPPPSSRRVITDRVAAVGSPDAERPGSTARIPKPPNPAERRNLLLWISIVMVVVIGGLAAFVLWNRSETRETPSPTVTTPPPPPPRPKPPELPPLERDLQALRRLLGEPLKSWNTRDIDAHLRNLAQASGPRREEFEKLKGDYERGLRILDLREGLLGRWSLDEADGTVAHDASGQGNDGTIVGSPGRVPGRIGGAFQIRGPDSYVEIPARGTLDVRDSGSFTLSAWFMPDVLPVLNTALPNDAYYGIVMRAGYHVGLSLARSGQVEMRSWTSDRKSVKLLSAERVLPKVWTHVAGIFDPRTGRASVFVNGKPSGEAVFPAKSAILPLETPWRIGIAEPRSKEIVWSARGLLDEVLFYGRALAPQEIALLAEGVVPPEADPRRQEPGISGLALHLAAERGVKLEDGLVASWSDPARGLEATSYIRDERPQTTSVGGQPALKFDGKNDYLAIPHQPALSFGEADSFTLAVRLHLAGMPAPGRWKSVAEKSQEAGAYYGIWIDEYNRWVFGSTQNLHGSPVKLGMTVVTAVQEGGKERRLYVDGQRVATGPAMNGSGTGAFRLCGTNARLEYFDGEILEVRVWRRALDPSEIRGMNR